MTYQSHGVSLKHIGENGLETIGKAITTNSDFFIIAVGKGSIFCNIFRYQIAVVFIRWITERLLDDHGQTDNQI